MLPPDLLLELGYFGVGIAGGIALGFMIARKRLERVIKEIVESYRVYGRTKYAPPDVVELMARRAGWTVYVARGDKGEQSR